MFINLYTQETPFYSVVNRLLREENRTLLIPYFHFLKAFLAALYCLPLCHGIVNRGVKLDLSADFEKGKEVTWWSINSTTENIEVLKSEQFLGKTGKRTLFQISAKSLVAIKDFSSLPEEEIILLPGTILVCVGVLDAGNGLTIIQMKEKEPLFLCLTSLVLVCWIHILTMCPSP